MNVILVEDRNTLNYITLCNLFVSICGSTQLTSDWYDVEPINQIKQNLKASLSRKYFLKLVKNS